MRSLFSTRPGWRRGRPPQWRPFYKGRTAHDEHHRAVLRASSERTMQLLKQIDDRIAITSARLKAMEAR